MLELESIAADRSLVKARLHGKCLCGYVKWCHCITSDTFCKSLAKVRAHGVNILLY